MIIVFGSINVDLVFNVAKLPTMGATVLCPGYFKAAGGKGLNQAVAAARGRPNAQLPVYMVGNTGNDEFGDIALNELKTAGVKIAHVVRGPDPTACAAVAVDENGENQIIVGSGANTTLSAENLPDSLLTKDTVLVLQMEVPVESNCKVIRRAKKKGARVILNLAPAAPFPEELISSLDLLIINEIEANMMANHNNLDTTSSRAAAKAIATEYSITTIVSLGAEGASAFDSNNEWQIGALPITPIDTVGAGDSFVGNLAIGMALDKQLPEMLHRASVGAGLSCLTEGAAPSMPNSATIEKQMGDLLPARKISG